MTKDAIALEMKALQDRICGSLEQIDGKSSFIEDKWDRVEGGG
jgi:coproporphyrinogen III oxidase